MKFRDNLLHLRQQRNMTQEQLAMLLGVSRQSVAKWEGGQSTPEVDKLVKMSELFGCSLDELVGEDLSARAVAPAEILPDGVPPTDVCGYDAHMRKFALGIATGVGLIIAGIAIALLATALVGEKEAEIIAPVCILAFVAIGLVFILPAALRHAAFAKAHPFVEDFYTPEQKEVEHHSFTIQLTIGIVLIVASVILVVFANISANEQLHMLAAAAMLILIAIGVWTIVRCGIVHGLTNVESYNRERADEQWERDNPRVGRICGIIMLVATVIALLLLFGGMAFDSSPAVSFFWVAWIIGGIGCAIATSVMRAAAEK